MDIRRAPVDRAYPTKERLWLPAGAVAESIPRWAAEDDAAASLISAELRCVGVVVPKNTPFNTITVVSGAQAAVAPTAQWAALVQASDLSILLKSADKTNTAWAANTASAFTLSATYTPTSDLAVYLCLCVVAGTVPGLRGLDGYTGINGIAPINSGRSTSSLTTPASLTVVDALSSATHVPYIWASLV